MDSVESATGGAEVAASDVGASVRPVLGFVVEGGRLGVEVDGVRMPWSVRSFSVYEDELRAGLHCVSLELSGVTVKVAGVTPRNAAGEAHDDV